MGSAVTALVTGLGWDGPADEAWLALGKVQEDQGLQRPLSPSLEQMST